MSVLFFLVNKSDDQLVRSDLCQRLADVINHLSIPGSTVETTREITDRQKCIYYLSASSVYQQSGNRFFFNAFGPVTPPEENYDCPSNAAFSFSNDDHQTVIASNLVSSRAVWYYKDDQQFIVSSSQRAIITFLGDFQLNQQAVSWMLATGNLGPGNSWDNRIQHLKPANTVTLDKLTWKLKTITRTNVKPVTQFESEERAMLELKEVFSGVFDWCSTAKNYPDTVLTLSGGYDSRTVLYNFLAKGLKVPTVTWGLSSALVEQGTDASVAAAVADELKIENRFFETDFREQSFEPLLNHFLSFGEGRLDHINSFMDGFKMWNQLCNEGVKRVIRADEVFGWVPANNEQDVRISLDFHQMEDNANMMKLEYFGLEPQTYPKHLMKREDESLDTWRDRLYREFRLPYVLTGLHDLIQPYVEVIDPLLHDHFMQYVNKLPDAYRTGKNLYIKYAKSVAADKIPVATKASIPEPASILRSARIVSLMLDELSSQDSRNVVSGKLVHWIEDHMKVDDSLVNATNNTLTTWIKTHTPWQLKKLLRRDLLKYKADFNQVAFRVVLVSRIKKMMSADAMALRFSYRDNK